MYFIVQQFKSQRRRTVLRRGEKSNILDDHDGQCSSVFSTFELWNWTRTCFFVLKIKLKTSEKKTIHQHCSLSWKSDHRVFEVGDRWCVVERRAILNRPVSPSYPAPSQLPFLHKKNYFSFVINFLQLYFNSIWSIGWNHPVHPLVTESRTETSFASRIFFMGKSSKGILKPNLRFSRFGIDRGKQFKFYKLVSFKSLRTIDVTTR